MNGLPKFPVRNLKTENKASLLGNGVRQRYDNDSSMSTWSTRCDLKCDV